MLGSAACRGDGGLGSEQGWPGSESCSFACYVHDLGRVTQLLRASISPSVQGGPCQPPSQRVSTRSKSMDRCKLEQLASLPGVCSVSTTQMLAITMTIKRDQIKLKTTDLLKCLGKEQGHFLVTFCNHFFQCKALRLLCVLTKLPQCCLVRGTCIFLSSMIESVHESTSHSKEPWSLVSLPAHLRRRNSAVRGKEGGCWLSHPALGEKEI